MKRIKLWPGAAGLYLTAARTMLRNAIAHQAKLQEKRTTLTIPKLNQLTQQAQTVQDTHIGADRPQNQRSKTEIVKAIQVPAKKALGDVYSIINSEWTATSPKRNEFLTSLGFNTFYDRVIKNEQQALVEHLEQFARTLAGENSPSRALLDAGTPPEILENITTYATSFDEANLEQEAAKGATVVLTDEAYADINNLVVALRPVISAAKRAFPVGDARRKLFEISTIMNAAAGGRSGDRDMGGDGQTTSN